MNLKALGQFEEMMERTLEGSFLRLLRPQLQPVEIARRLGRAMEAGQVVGAGKVYVPNAYVVRLNPADFSTFEPYLASLKRDLAEYLVEAAAEREVLLPGPPQVDVRPDPALAAHTLGVEARLADPVLPTPDERVALSGGTTRLSLDELRKPSALPRAALVQGGGENAARIGLDRFPVALGRSFDNDVVLDDRRVSRHHAQIRSLADGYALVDLGSTNGSFVNGERVSQRKLKRGDVISLGGLELAFDLEATP